MKFIKIIFITSFFIACITGYFIVQKNTLRPKLHVETLLVGVCDNCPPYMFKNEHQLVGYDIDVLAELGKRMSKNIAFKIASDDDLQQFLKDGTVHMVCMRPNHAMINNRIILSDQYKELKIPFKNTLYELEEDGTLDDIAQRWSVIKK